jgi:hypothetical protein
MRGILDFINQIIPNLAASAIWAVPGFFHLHRQQKRHHKEATVHREKVRDHLGIKP